MKDKALVKAILKDLVPTTKRGRRILILVSVCILLVDVIFFQIVTGFLAGYFPEG